MPSQATGLIRERHIGEAERETRSLADTPSRVIDVVQRLPQGGDTRQRSRPARTPSPAIQIDGDDGPITRMTVE